MIDLGVTRDGGGWRPVGQGGAWPSVLRRDPCAYCFGAGGTVDHIMPKPLLPSHLRGRPENMTGCCEPCNRRKDTGNGQHRTVLAQLLAVLEGKDRARRELVRTPGTVVAGPFFERGVVTALDGVSMLVDVPGRAEPWRCYSWRALRPL